MRKKGGGRTRKLRKIAHALFEDQGTKLYPDATFTLRLSYGAVKGYRENGKFVTPSDAGGLSRVQINITRVPLQPATAWTSKRSV